MTTASAVPHGIQVAHWLAWADRDYLAARCLLLRRFVLQGTTLTNTAIEKYLKAALVAKNISFRNSHDVVALHQQLKANAPKLPAINTAFLSQLVKAYKLRYPDDLPVGFNIALSSAKVLTETDLAVHALRGGFVLQRSDGRSVETYFDGLLARKDPSLLEQNVPFGSSSRAEIFASPSACYELRVVSQANIIWAEYETQNLPDDGKWDTEGLKPKPAN